MTLWSNSNGSKSMKSTFTSSQPTYVHCFHQDWQRLVKKDVICSVKLNKVMDRKLKCLCMKTSFSISKVLIHINNEILIFQRTLLLCHLNLLLFWSNSEYPLLCSLPASSHRNKSMDNWSKYFLELKPAISKWAQDWISFRSLWHQLSNMSELQQHVPSRAIYYPICLI